MSNFATVADLEKYWRPLTTEEQTRAEFLIEIASSRLRIEAQKAGIAINDRVAYDEDYALAVELVVMDAVKRAIATPIDTPPVDNFSQSAGPYSENYRFTNPSGDLWFKKAELRSIGIGVAKMSSITPNTRKDVYGE